MSISNVIFAILGFTLAFDKHLSKVLKILFVFGSLALLFNVKWLAVVSAVGLIFYSISESTCS